ncbi:sensor histidine kinase [Methylobacterium iners]|uniref:Blue-light-activated histidine kinase n=1 Tax=Methylobacterium iners TaxID=418707 RepID=A0ABQ4S4H8_9HYPH|nr:PAS domain-containing protein [Methylobacterium iners]GJD98033.1 hypothetical protein OCOJLMKI_5272 [Methylobacterium iners]
MAKRIREYDWPTTQIGPAASWPLSLRTAIDIMLTLQSPASLLWGPDRIHLYNDAYVPIAAERHPLALGRPIDEEAERAFAISPGPRLNQLFAGETVALADCAMAMLGANGVEERVFAGSLIPIRDERGAVGGAFHLLVETTARVCPDAKLRESEERFRSFAENSADVLWIADAAGRGLEYLSPAFEGMYGTKREPIMADLARWAELIHPDDREAAQGFFPRAAAGETAIAHYRVIRPEDGRVVHLRDTGFPVRDEATGRIERVGGIVQDVSDLARAGGALEAEKERFRTLAEGIPQLAWRAADGGHWTWASPRWLAYTGQSEAESQGLGWLDAVHPDDRDSTLCAWHDAEARAGLSVEYRVRRAADGTWRWFQTRALLMHKAASEVSTGREWLGASDDIDDLKRLHGRQHVLVEELQHRTRNLLAVVRSIAQQTMARTGHGEAFRLQFNDRLAALSRVQGLLSRASGEPITIGALVRMELDALGAKDAEGRIVLSGPDVSLRNTMVQTLALALHELATNARKYGALATNRGSLRVSWTVRDNTHRDERRLWLEWMEEGLDCTHITQNSTRNGYGRELIERALPYALGATTGFELGENAVRCTIDLPLSKPR